jgi:hypothetical protein
MTVSVQPLSGFVGRVLSSSTRSYELGCRLSPTLQVDALPHFGAFVTGPISDILWAYGLVYNWRIDGDALVEVLAAEGVLDEQYILDQREIRQMPVKADVLVVGYREEEHICYRLPPVPALSLNRVLACDPGEVMAFTEHHTWLRTVVDAADIPTHEQLIAAVLCSAARARPPAARGPYLRQVGRELARLLASDPARLASIWAKVE